jgi:hypothetical protein
MQSVANKNKPYITPPGCKAVLLTLVATIVTKDGVEERSGSCLEAVEWSQLEVLEKQCLGAGHPSL